MNGFEALKRHGPLLYIWGAQWMLDAILQYLTDWDFAGTLRTVLLWTAAALSALWLVRDGLAKGEPDEHGRGPQSLLPLLPVAVLVLSVALLVRLEAVDLYFVEMFRALVLSFFYVLIGVLFGRELVYLGLWLFGLSAVIGLWYLGYAPVVLGFFGGASLIACAVIFRIWNKAASPASE